MGTKQTRQTKIIDGNTNYRCSICENFYPIENYYLTKYNRPYSYCKLCTNEKNSLISKKERRTI